jgi:hypothetical protein
VHISYIVNAYRNFAVPVIRLYNQELEERDYFTYLGMIFDKNMNSHHAVPHALRPFNAAIRRVKDFGFDKMIWTDLMRCCDFSRHMRCQLAAMYASQIWSTQFLEHDNVFSNPLQVAHMAFLNAMITLRDVMKADIALGNSGVSPRRTRDAVAPTALVGETHGTSGQCVSFS